jgi:hypothetical protein
MLISHLDRDVLLLESWNITKDLISLLVLLYIEECSEFTPARLRLLVCSTADFAIEVTEESVEVGEKARYWGSARDAAGPRRCAGIWAAVLVVCWRKARGEEEIHSWCCWTVVAVVDWRDYCEDFESFLRRLKLKMRCGSWLLVFVFENDDGRSRCSGRRFYRHDEYEQAAV